MEGGAAGHSNKDRSWERVWLADTIEPEPTSEKPVSIIGENSAKQPLQEHGVKSILLSWASLILAFVEPEVNPANLAVILLFPGQLVESPRGGISTLRGIARQSGRWCPVAMAKLQRPTLMLLDIWGCMILCCQGC